MTPESRNIRPFKTVLFVALLALAARSDIPTGDRPKVSSPVPMALPLGIDTEPTMLPEPTATILPTLTPTGTPLPTIAPTFVPTESPTPEPLTGIELYEKIAKDSLQDNPLVEKEAVGSVEKLMDLDKAIVGVVLMQHDLNEINENHRGLDSKQFMEVLSETDYIGFLREYSGVSIEFIDDENTGQLRVEVDGDEQHKLAGIIRNIHSGYSVSGGVPSCVTGAQGILAVYEAKALRLGLSHADIVFTFGDGNAVDQVNWSEPGLRTVNNGTNNNSYNGTLINFLDRFGSDSAFLGYSQRPAPDGHVMFITVDPLDPNYLIVIDTNYLYNNQSGNSGVSQIRRVAIDDPYFKTIYTEDSDPLNPFGATFIGPDGYQLFAIDENQLLSNVGEQ